MTIIASGVLALTVFIQPPPAQPAGTPRVAAPAPAPVPTPPAFLLNVKGGIMGTVEIQAKQVETKAILEQLKKELKIPLLATNIVAQHKVDLVFKQASIPTLLLALAPVVLADLEVSAGPDETAWKTIHLLGYNEKEPGRAIKQTGFLIMAGVPPEDGKAPAEDPAVAARKADEKKLAEEPKDSEKPVLTVVVTEGRVSARVRKQPLIALLNEIAMKAAIPIDLRGRVDMVPVDLELKDMPLRDLIAAIGRPGVRLVIRRNLATGEEIVQGILVGDARLETPVP